MTVTSDSTHRSGAPPAHTDVSGGVDLMLVVAAKREVAEGVLVLSLCDAAGRDLPPWEPGAHVDLMLGPDLVRQYSLCGDAADPSQYQIAVLRERHSRGGSEHIHQRIMVGSSVHARGPRNHFQLLPSDRYLFIAGGIGITPIIPMVRAAETAGADWRLVYGGRTRSSMAFADSLRSQYPDRVVVSPQDEVGLLDLQRLMKAPTEGQLLVYCCGPEPLLAAAEARCAALCRTSLHVERFMPKPVPGPVLQGSFEVELRRSSKVLRVPPEKSILEVAEVAGVGVPSSCEEGTCGTCETRVLAGIVDHRDSILSADEQARNDTMMVCVSRSAGPRLVLDL